MPTFEMPYNNPFLWGRSVSSNIDTLKSPAEIKFDNALEYLDRDMSLIKSGVYNFVFQGFAIQLLGEGGCLSFRTGNKYR